ncbi:MAG: FAD-dependent oxidoreductase [Isosphaeraceae bacterium]
MRSEFDGGWESWGRYPKVAHEGCLVPEALADVPSLLDSVRGHPVLPRGAGRSYGDACLNEGGYLLSTRQLNRIVFFDEEVGAIRCEAGVSLGEILSLCVPRGWFLPVTPGTMHVTVGGAIANDVHGKNHHWAGCFGNHSTRFLLWRTDGGLTACSRGSNPDLFRATLGGLGLTGVILWAELKLKPIGSPNLAVESIRFDDLDQFFALSQESIENYEYSVAWIDCLAGGRGLCRGLFLRGNHQPKDLASTRPSARRLPWTVPENLPPGLLSPWTARLLNSLHYHRQWRTCRCFSSHYEPFFYPLDRVNHWNRLYGRRGFLQWQCVVPPKEGEEVIRSILKEVARSRLAPFLGVLKEFGDTPALGMLSFPMPGVTLALDFANLGDELLSALERLDRMVLECGGRINPAKDSRMSAATFRASFPGLDEFTHHVDPGLSSSLFRRIGGLAAAPLELQLSN